MTAAKQTFRDRVASASEIELTVTGRKSGRAISQPIWFVAEGDTLYLLPVRGSDTQWYKNILRNPSIQIAANGATEKAQAKPLTDATQVAAVIGKFRGKYGADVKKYYSKFDVAVVAQLR